jgi:hypothetical protein
MRSLIALVVWKDNYDWLIRKDVEKIVAYSALTRINHRYLTVAITPNENIKIKGLFVHDCMEIVKDEITYSLFDRKKFYSRMSSCHINTTAICWAPFVRRRHGLKRASNRAI